MGALTDEISRDPIGETGGENLYCVVRNGPTLSSDRLGMIGPVDPWPEYPLPPGGPKPRVLPPQDNPCDEYKKSYPTPKCLCNCKHVADNYPTKAERVCNKFMEKYDWSESAQCVARCLAGVERGMKSVPHCSVRALTRLTAHFTCYAGCGFYPWKGLPPGGLAVGGGEILKTLRTCRDPWDQRGKDSLPPKP